MSTASASDAARSTSSSMAGWRSTTCSMMAGGRSCNCAAGRAARVQSRSEPGRGLWSRGTDRHGRVSVACSALASCQRRTRDRDAICGADSARPQPLLRSSDKHRTALRPRAHCPALLELFVRYRAHWPGHRAEEMQLPLTQEHIADATGLTGVHVNRVLGELRGEGIVQFHYRKLPHRFRQAGGSRCDRSASGADLDTEESVDSERAKNGAEVENARPSDRSQCADAGRPVIDGWPVIVAVLTSGAGGR